MIFLKHQLLRGAWIFTPVLAASQVKIGTSFVLEVVYREALYGYLEILVNKWYGISLLLILPHPLPCSTPSPLIFPNTESVGGRFRNNGIIHLGLKRCMRVCHALKRDKNIPGGQKSIIGKSVKVYGQLWGSVI